MKPYRIRDAQSAQIQSVGLSAQIGGAIVGIAPSAWYRNEPAWGPFSLRVMAPDWNCGMRTIFELRILRLQLRWMSRGETHPGHYRWDDAGLTLRLIKKHKRARLKKVA